MEPGIKTSHIAERYSDFIESAAHDLHSPLRKLSVLVDRVFTKHKEQFDGDTIEYVRRIEHCVSEMQLLVNGLTDLARTEAKNSVCTPCDLAVIVNQLVSASLEEAQNAAAEIRVDALPVVNGIRVQYQQLFKNLLENSLKFRKPGTSSKISISSRKALPDEIPGSAADAEKKYYQIEVCDEGIGFEDSVAEKIFEPFVRLHAKSLYEGNGLGLSICKKIVNNHQGVIFAHGKENAGARFVVIIPETPQHLC